MGYDYDQEGDCKACYLKCKEGQACILNKEKQLEPTCLQCKKDTDCGTEKTAACVNKHCKTCFMPCNETATCTAKNDDAKCEASNNPKPTTPKHAHGDSDGATCSLMLFAAMLLTSIFIN